MAQKNINSKSAFIYTPDFMLYKFSENHPFNPLRARMTYELLKKIHALKDCHICAPDTATDDDLLLAHSSQYIQFVKSIDFDNINEARLESYGLGIDSDDTPIFKNMHQAGLTIVGATLSAVNMVLSKKVDHALNLSGGLHHALYGKASGFCIYNDIVVAIRHIVNEYNMKVLYVDTDAHHGDGVQWAFYDDPNVCTLSIHETGRYLFPGTGGITERGSGKGLGFTFNIPVDAFTEDDSWLWCYQNAMESVAEYFKPDIIITQNGADGHYYDPLSHLNLTMESYKTIPKIAHNLAHKYCEGRWVALGGGGYDIFRVVPRAWSYLWLEMSEYNEEIEKKLPTEWIEKWQKYSHNSIPQYWDDPEDLYEPIPRKEEINYKNMTTLKNALYTITKGQIGNNFFLP